MSKWCWGWPYCSCGVVKAKELLEADQKMLVWRNDVGDIKRVPCSELVTFANVEGIDLSQYTTGCPQTNS